MNIVNIVTLSVEETSYPILFREANKIFKRCASEAFSLSSQEIRDSKQLDGHIFNLIYLPIASKVSIQVCKKYTFSLNLFHMLICHKYLR